MSLAAIEQRIRDRLSVDWLTPSQRHVWEQLHRFHGPPHRVVNVYGPRGSGKSFLGWLIQREGYATYSKWSDEHHPVHPRLTLDNAPADREASRSVRPLTDTLAIRQIILLSRERVDEPDLPAFGLAVTEDDLDHFRANLYRHLGIIIPEVKPCYRDYREALETYVSRRQDGTH